MTIIERAKDYQKRGWFTNMSVGEIHVEIAKLETEIKRADKRTYNGKITRSFNESKIIIAKLILKAHDLGGI
jgi:hypothetical protein